MRKVVIHHSAMFPKYSEIQIPLLRELSKRGGRSKPSERGPHGRTVYEALADYFDLSEEARNTEIPASGRSKWKNMVRWARNDLKKKGHLNSPRHGVWEISERGWQVLENAKSEATARGDFDEDEEIDPETFKKSQEIAEEIGEAGEEYVLSYEIQELKSNGLAELADRVHRVSLENVAAGFDILSYYSNGDEKYIEVKSSKSHYTDFEITINELRTAKQHGDDYWIYRVKGVGTESVDVTKLRNPVKLIEEEDLLLQPTKFRVSLGEEIEE
ncbi:hypothetical protein CRI93_14095 [Longimonas halophila]|uniref:Protein NO VEIN C-terminal domain-containing protein n=1 Tax=Longimonas halophila TaxID=1469170 RepID=A0A2H3NL00_9BACT|nr:winged helix-turn-helix domain-containing protein [Longimonas halophila]PEN05041.1 hypothetical protein CRI93_14095 [Longimonas halophila]